jgi:hypothetical protein
MVDYLSIGISVVAILINISILIIAHIQGRL